MPKQNNSDNDNILTLVMPVLNEGDAIIPVIATLFFSVNYPFKLIIVYDSEEDKTIASVKKLQPYFDNLHLLQNEWKSGSLNALRTGFKHADTKYVGIWVSYHLDPFGITNDMVKKLEDGYDLVSANRFTVETKRARGNFIKKLLSYTGNMIINKIIEIPISDITTSTKVYTKSLLDDIKIETVSEGGWAMSTELAIKAAIKGYRLGEVHLEMKNMNLIHGITNFRVLKQLPAYFSWLLFGWKNRKLIKSHQHKQ